MSLSDKALAVLAGIGLWWVAATVLAQVESLLGPYVLLWLGVPSTDLRVMALRTLFPSLAVLAGTVLIGWLVGRKGWLYGIAAVLSLQLPVAVFTLGPSIRLVLEMLQDRIGGPVFGWSHTERYAGTIDSLLVTFPVLAPLLMVGLGALGGLLGQGCCQSSIAKLRDMSQGAKKWLVSLSVVAGVGLLFACLLLWSLAQRVESDSESAFRELLGEGLNRRVLLVTEKQRYRADETITLWVENRTGRTIWFSDQSLGVQGLAYDRAAGNWVEVDLDLWPLSPEAKRVQSGVLDFGDRVSLPVERIDVPKDGRVRLVVTGHMDVSDSEQDRLYTAYTDIEILQ
ncbi:MAG: hypothetical protein CEE40_10715 [Chloroflexi bacterium B3_Chlor]|nr:MAG: hypothetical protein CEE40_10715 [Chloroflexi bacterium B3_Chlor]